MPNENSPYWEWCEQVDKALEVSRRSSVIIGEALWNLQNRQAYKQFWRGDERFMAYLRGGAEGRIADRQINNIYYKWRWGFGKSAANRYIQSYRINQILQTRVSPMGVTSERALRPLGRLLGNPALLVEAYERAVELAEGESPTYRQTEQAVAEIKSEWEVPPPSRLPKPDPMVVDTEPTTEKQPKLIYRRPAQEGYDKFMEIISKLKGFLYEGEFGEDIRELIINKERYKNPFFQRTFTEACNELIRDVEKLRDQVTSRTVDTSSEPVRLPELRNKTRVKLNGAHEEIKTKTN